MKFKLLLPNGDCITGQTRLTKNGMPFKIEDNKQLLQFIKKLWCKWCEVKSFEQWAKELNDEFGHNSEDRFSAINHMSSSYTLNIDGKHINIYRLWMQEYPNQKA